MLYVSYPKRPQRLVPMFKTEIPCGDPQEIENAEVSWIDIAEYLAGGAADAAVYVHVKGDSMIDCGIEHGDLLVVDRSMQPENGKRVVVSVNGEYTVKRWQETFNESGARNGLYLVPGNEDFAVRELSYQDEIHCFGVVKFIIKKSE